MDNIILIGMPGSGKSTVGALLAASLGMVFVDTDAVFQAQQRRTLQDMLNDIGVDAFLALEEACVAGLDVHGSVIATGGSVVYGRLAMQNLHRLGTVVYLRLPYEEIERRLQNLATRGVTLRPGQTLHDLYEERIMLYEAEADVVFDSSSAPIEETARTLAARMRALGGAQDER